MTTQPSGPTGEPNTGSPELTSSQQLLEFAHGLFPPEATADPTQPPQPVTRHAYGRKDYTLDFAPDPVDGGYHLRITVGPAGDGLPGNAVINGRLTADGRLYAEDGTQDPDREPVDDPDWAGDLLEMAHNSTDRPIGVVRRLGRYGVNAVLH